MSAFDWRGPSSFKESSSVTLGRPRLYDDEQREQRHREAARKWWRENGKQRRLERIAALPGLALDRKKA